MFHDFREMSFFFQTDILTVKISWKVSKVQKQLTAMRPGLHRWMKNAKKIPELVTDSHFVYSAEPNITICEGAAVNSVFSAVSLKACGCVCLVSLSGGCVGGIQDLLRQDPRDVGVPEMGSHMSTRVTLHLRPRQKLQQLRGTHEHDSEGKKTHSGLREHSTCHSQLDNQQQSKHSSCIQIC